MYQFKHLLCYLCSIVNKILAHVFWKSFSFHFIQIKKRPNISGIRVVYIYIYIYINTYMHTYKTKIQICDPLCKNQAKVKKSNSDITSIKLWLQALISLWFQYLTWPYSVNIKDTNNISLHKCSLQYVAWFYAENSKSKKNDFR